jgi:hypothetical protein
MNQPTLTEEQKKRLRFYVDSYQKWLKTQDGIGNVSEHHDHEFYFKSKLIASKIDSLNEKEFREMYKALWASSVWTNKDWYIDNKLLKPNGLERARCRHH